MKVRSKKAAKEFQPIELTVTLQSVEEAEMLFKLFNWVPLCEFIGRTLNHEEVRRELCSQGIDNPGIADLEQFVYSHRSTRFHRE